MVAVGPAGPPEHAVRRPAVDTRPAGCDVFVLLECPAMPEHIYAALNRAGAVVDGCEVGFGGGQLTLGADYEIPVPRTGGGGLGDLSPSDLMGLLNRARVDCVWWRGEQVVSVSASWADPELVDGLGWGGGSDRAVGSKDQREA